MSDTDYTVLQTISGDVLVNQFIQDQKMSHLYSRSIQKDSLFNAILKARQIKLEKEKKLIDYIWRDKYKHLYNLNRSRFFRYERDMLDDIDHYSDSEISINQTSDAVLITKKPITKKKHSPIIQQNYQQLTEEEILREKAKRFIARLRKQKQYNEGKLLLMRKKEQQRHEQQLKKMDLQRKSVDFINKKIKMNRIMDRILHHEERISERAAISLKKTHARAKTENTQRAELSKSLNIEKDDEEIINLKRKVNELSRVVQKLVS